MPGILFLNDGVRYVIIVRRPICFRFFFFFVYLGHGIIHWDAILFWLKPVFGRGMELLLK